MGGGSNDKNFSYKILKKINNFKRKLNLVFLLGFEINLNDNFKKIIQNSHHKISILKNKYFINKLISESFLIISAFGVTAYEIAALQKYSILFTRTKDDEISASIFKNNNISYNISNTSIFNERIFNRAINNYQKYLSKKKFKYSKFIRSGAKTIAKIINETLKKK